MLALVVAIGLCAVPRVSAQIRDTTIIGPFAVDIRGAFPRYGPTEELAAPYAVRAADLPSHGLGLDLGAHWYPLKWRNITFGIGGTVLFSSGRQGPTIVEEVVTGHDVDITFTALSPQVSFNFGSGKGWSYVSGGLGYSTMTIATEKIAALETQPSRKTINYGGGARWFSRKHLAFTLDVRFYAVNPQEQMDDVKTAPRMTLLVLSAGVSFK